ncbi:MAG: chemotaxis protein CheW [Acidobacteria bacterium]|nr:chemotaxis protein CheW [Acidobacteriota bacterium]
MAEAAFVHFEISGDRLGVLLDEIREVARVTRVTPVPRAPAAVRGVANIRGRVVTLIDVDVLYSPPGSPGPRGDGPGHAVVLAAPRENLALFTRARVDIGRGQESSISGGRPGGPRAADGLGAPPYAALVEMDGRMVHLLSAADLAAHCEARVLKRFRTR